MAEFKNDAVLLVIWIGAMVIVLACLAYFITIDWADLRIIIFGEGSC